MSGKDHTFIVGDVHGCMTECMLLLQKAGYKKEDHRLIFVGDLINKGPDSFEVLKWTRDNKIEVVIGNHELKFIESIENNLALSPCFEDLKLKMQPELNQWIDYIKSWPAYIEESDFIVVHAGIVPGEHPKNSKLENIINIRKWDLKKNKISSTGKPWHDYYSKEKLVIYGHWATQGLLKKECSIGLDSGCVYGKQLSGVWLPSKELIQVKSSFTASSNDYKPV